MSIDARIAAVTVIAPTHCEACNGSGQSDGDTCDKCHGATKDKPVVRLRLEPRKPSTCAGQGSLVITNPPSIDPLAMSSMVGVAIWGNSSVIMIRDRMWAKRIGYTQIELL